MGRVGNVDELVGCAIFLASDASSFVTGQTIPGDLGVEESVGEGRGRFHAETPGAREGCPQGMGAAQRAPRLKGYATGRDEEPRVFRREKQGPSGPQDG